MSPVTKPRSLSLGVLLASLVSLVSACSDSGALGGPSAPAACAPGNVADAQGACVPAVCAAGERKDADSGACVALGWQACPAGFVADASGHGCRDVLPTAACATGTMPVLGQVACQPVGPASCAVGFERDPSGWGCRAILPAASCAGATKETLGSTSCTPVGDCAAAFPPAGSTLFVNAAFTDGQLDATHVRTLGAALAVAGANAVIAVEAGTYTETLAVTKSVRIVGRCAAQVTLAGAGAATAGVAASGPVDVSVEGMTLSGHLFAVTAQAKASVTLRDDVLDGNRGGAVSALDPGTHAVIERSVIRGTAASGPARGVGIETNNGADLALRDSTVTDNVETGVLVGATGSHALLDHAVILSTRADAGGDFGVGLMVRDGASGEISATALAHNHEASVVSYGTGTHAVLTDVVIADSLVSASSGVGHGILADTGALQLERVTVTGSHDVGILVEHKADLKAHQTVVRGTQPAADATNGFGVALITGATASFSASAVVDNMSAGLSAVGPLAKLTLATTLVADNVPDSTGDLGYGIELELGATADLQDSALVGNAEAALYATDAATHAALARTILSGTRAGKGKRHGRGMAIEAGASASLAQTAVVGNRDVAVSARGAGTVVTFDQVVVRGTLPQDLDAMHGRGIEADEGAQMTVTRSSLLDNHGTAILGASSSVVDVRDAWIADTLADASVGGPGRAVTAQSDAHVTLLGLVIQRSTQIALVTTASASLSVRGSLVEDTHAAADGSFGHGLLAYDGALLVVDDVTVSGSAGVALAFSASRGNVSRARISANAVGINAQDGSTLHEVAVVPDDPAENSVNVSADSTFDGNGARVGSGPLPLPVPLQ